MIALQGIERLFSAQEIARGRAYHAEGAVELAECEHDRVLGRVLGSEWYDVSIASARSGWKIDCTCPAFERERSCKHLFATVLAARDELRGAKNARAGPRSVAELLSDHSGGTLVRASELPEPRRAPPRGPRRPSWRELLDELELETDDEDELSSTLALRYVLRVIDPLLPIAPMLETHVATPSKRGGVNSFRLAAVQPSRRADLGAQDLEFLALLWGAHDEYVWSDRERARASSPMPAELQAALLPRIAASGRLFLGIDEHESHEPLRPAAGRAWELVVALEADKKSIDLRARVQRGDERIALQDCDAVFEGGLFVAQGELHAVDWRGAWAWVQVLRRCAGAAIPRAQTSRVLDMLAASPGEPRIEAPEFLSETGGTPRGLLRVSLGTRAGQDLRAEILFEYGAERLTRSNRARFLRRGEQLIRVAREPEVEARLVGEFVAAGGRIDVRRGEAQDASVSAPTFPALARTLTRAGWTIEAQGNRLRTDAEISVSVRSGVDWFDLSASMDFGDAHAAMPELLRALRERDRMVVLSDGSRGLLPERWLESWELGQLLSEERGDALRFAKNRAWLLDAFLEGETAVDGDAAFHKACEFFRSATRSAAQREPRAFRGELREYQREGLGWLDFLARIGMGGCLADDMGLGKTVQVLAAVLARREAARGPALVVAPRSVLFNWVREAERFAPALNVVLHHGSARTRRAAVLEDADLVVTSYGTLRQDAGMLAKLPLDCAILDEAQAIKNPTSLSAKAACTLRADLRLALTGTPVENHLGEVLSIFRFLNPGLLDQGARLDRLLERAEDDVAAARLLSRALRPFLLRRTKEEVLPELPAKTEQLITCELEGAERRAYDELRAHYRRELLGRADEVGIERMQMNVLEALLRLRQAACHPGLLDARRAGEDSAKLDVLLPMLEEVRESGHKALVFSQFTSFLAILRKKLDEDCVVYEYLDGKTQKREQKVRRFQEDASVPLFLISLKAGGSGLNLTAADYVFLMDPWWNPAVETQAVDRTHRIGQTRPVTAYRLVAKDTVEEKVLELQGKKRALAQALFESAGTTLRDLTREDLAWILG